MKCNIIREAQEAKLSTESRFSVESVLHSADKLFHIVLICQYIYLVLFWSAPTTTNNNKINKRIKVK